MAETPPLLTPPLIGELLLQLRTDRVRKLECVAALTEGVCLAVEQVQEVRLAHIEAGPESTMGDLVADAFWGFLFDSSINILFSRAVLDRFLGSLDHLTAGMAIIHARRGERLKAKALNDLEQGTPSYARYKALNDMMILRANFSTAERKGFKTSVERLSPELKTFLKKYEDTETVVASPAELLQRATEEVVNIFNGKAVSSAQKELANAFTLSSLDLRDFRIMVRDDPVAQGSVGVAVEQLLGNTRRFLADSGSVPTGVPATDLLASVYAWGSRQRQQIALIYDNAECLLLQGAHLQDIGEVCVLLAATRDAMQIDLGEIRARAWMLSEAVMWAETYRGNLLGLVGATGSMSNELALIGIPGRIADYLTDRYAEDARKWVSSSNADAALALPAERAMESTSNAQVRNWAISTLRRARENAKTRPGAVTSPNFLEKLLNPDAKTSTGDATAVRSYLLAMLLLYRNSAQGLIGLLEKTRDELKRGKG